VRSAAIVGAEREQFKDDSTARGGTRDRGGAKLMSGEVGEEKYEDGKLEESNIWTKRVTIKEGSGSWAIRGEGQRRELCFVESELGGEE
jgi:hypothetical protein